MTDTEIIKALAEAIDLMKRQQAEIDILIRKKDTLRDELAEQNAKIERFENIESTLNKFWDILLKYKIAKRKETPTLEEFAEAIQEIQDEAIKEFAERLKKELSVITANDGGFVPIIVDNLVAEMTGETFEGR